LSFDVLPIERLDELVSAGPYDGILSNFSGLNCVADLDAIAGTLSRLVRPGGRVVLCIFGTFCLWEVAWYLSTANLSKAFRRFRRNGTKGGPGAIDERHRLLSNRYVRSEETRPTFPS
jgi:hypothetical protein